MKTIMILTVTTMLVIAGCVKEDLCIRGEGKIEERALTLEAFNSIDLRSSMSVVISSGERQEVVAKGHANIIDHLVTEVENGKWGINLEQGCYNFFELTVYITLPDLANVELNGSGNILIKDFSNQGDLRIESRGSGNITVQSVSGSESVEVIISGSGKIDFENEFPDIKTLNINISGSGSFHGFPAITPFCNVKVSGSGNCEVSVEDQLDVMISGSGNVYYKGRPEINVSDTGSGRLISRN